MHAQVVPAAAGGRGVEGYAKLSRRLAARRDLTQPQKLLLATVLNLQQLGGGACVQPWARIADEVGRDERSVRRMVRRVNTRFPGLIAITARPGEANVMSVNFNALPGFNREGHMTHPGEGQMTHPGEGQMTHPPSIRKKNSFKNSSPLPPSLRGGLFDPTVRKLRWIDLERQRVRDGIDLVTALARKIGDRSVRFVFVEGRRRVIVGKEFSNGWIRLQLAREGDTPGTEPLLIPAARLTEWTFVG